MTVFPESVCNNDEVYTRADKQKFVDQIYKTGYYTAYSIDKSPIYSIKNGISFDPDTTCTGGTQYTNGGTAFIGKVIKNEADSNEVDNYSNEYKLFKYGFRGTSIVCTAPFPKIMNDNYILRLRIALYSTDLITVKFNGDGDGDEAIFDNLDCTAIQIDNLYSIFEITSKQHPTSSTSRYMKFTHNGISKEIEVTNTNIKISFSSSDPLYVSNYVVTIEDSSTDSYATRNGEKNCDDTSNPCIPNYMCSGGLCKKCHQSCNRCTHDESISNAQTACTRCNVLTANKEPTNGECKINYIDLHYFKDFEAHLNAPKTHRVTMGTWVFISQINIKQSFKITLKDFMILKLDSDGSSNSHSCIVYENLNRGLESPTYGDHLISESVPSPDQAATMKGHSISGYWFHITCAMSFDHSMFYQSSVINGVFKYNQQHLPYEHLFNGDGGSDADYNSVYYRPIFETSDLATLYFQGFTNFDFPIYLKYFTLFEDFIPFEFKYMYFDFQNVNTFQFPELSFVIPFDELVYGNDYHIITKNIAAGSAYDENITFYLKENQFDVSGPLNFRHLILPEINKKYTTIDLNTILPLEGIPPSSSYSQINHDDNLPIRCQNRMKQGDPRLCAINDCGSYVTNVDGSSDTVKYIRYPGLMDGNYCDYKCTPSMSCNDKYWIPDFCKPELNVYNMFYTCVDKNTEYYLQFSYFYHSKKLSFAISQEMQSFIIELWYYPDLLANSKDENSIRHYIFHSNVLDIYIQANQLVLLTSYGNSKTANYHNREWNKFTIKVKFNTNNTYSFSTKVNRQNISLAYTSTKAKANLELIQFCNSCPGIDGTIYWTNGFYKNLRVWDGDLISIDTIEEIERLYSDEQIVRITGLIAYYPLKGQYILNNVVKGLKGASATESPVENNSNLIYRRYNYGNRFDYIVTMKPDLGYTLQNTTDGYSTDKCPEHCSRCWSSSIGTCFQCYQGYFIKDGECVKGVNFFKVPGRYSDSLKIDVSSLNLNESSSINGVTVTFWIRPFAFVDKIFEYYEGYSVLKYNGDNINDKDTFGLSLIIGSTEDTRKTYAIDNNFRDKIGIWSYISLAYHRYKTEDSIEFPNMLQLEINDEAFKTDFKIMSTNLNVFGKYFHIPYSLYALFYRLIIYTEYITGTYGFEMLKQDTQLKPPFSKPTPQGKIFFPYTNSETGCYEPSDFLDTTSSINTNTFQCSPDYEVNFNESLKNGIVCDNSCQNVCYNGKTTGCSCINVNSHSQYLLKELENPIECRMLKFINFAKINPITVERVLTAQSTKKYTLQFWLYVYNYHKNNWKGMTVTWIGHNKIKIDKTEDGATSLGDNEYRYICYAKTDSSGNQGLDSLSTRITVNQWNFISCAVDYTLFRIYINVNLENNDRIRDHKQLSEVSYSDIVAEEDRTNLTITEDTGGSIEWGMLYIDQLRLWKEAYFNTDFLCRVEIIIPSRFPNLLNTWNTRYQKKKGDYFLQNRYVTEIVSEAGLPQINFTVVYPFTETLGYNYVTSDTTVELCDDNGKFYDTTNEECVQFTDVSKIDNLTFTNVPYSYSGSYTMAFWVFFEDASAISAGLHVTWTELMQISILMEGRLTAICFPQDFYTSKYTNDNIRNKYSSASASNFAVKQITLVDQGESDSGVWIYITCAVSNYYETFYIIGNDPGQYEEVPINHEILYVDDEEVYSEYPMKYFLSNIESSVKKTTLKMENLRNTAKNYFRSIQLFRDYIPRYYDIKYEDLTKIENSYMPSLVMVCNFAHVVITETNTGANIFLDYYVYNIDRTSSSGRKYVKSKLSLRQQSNESSFELSANFIFLPLCDFTNNKKYDEDSNTCITISLCNNQELNSQYCMGESKAFVCLQNYYVNPTDTNVTCNSECLNKQMRIPGTMETKGICSVNISSGVNTTFGSAAALSGYPSMVECGSGNQIDYKCKDADPINSALFYSRCYNPPNFYKTLSNSVKQKFASGYLLEFWFKFDHVLFFCDHTNNEYYFYSTPHSIYLEYTSSTYYYAVINNPNYKSSLEGISQHEWNKIVIRTTLGSITGQNVIVYVNYNLDTPGAQFSGIPDSINMQLQYISFCARYENGYCTSAGNANINWGSAYYRNIRVWDLLSADILVVQAFNNKYYEYNIVEHPASLIIYYPLTIDYIDKNSIQDIVSKEHIKVTHANTLNFDSNDDFLFYNYETKFDWGIAESNHSGHYISAIDENRKVTYAKCHDACRRCFSNAQTECYECEPLYVLIGKKCTERTGYFARTPGEFVLENDLGNGTVSDLKQYTISFWMKFLGVISTSNSLYPIIFSIQDDTYMAYDTNAHTIVLNIGSSIPYVDSNFRSYYGIWIHIGIASYVSENITVFPHMFIWSVNKIDIPHDVDFSLPDTGIGISSLTFGGECITLFSDFRVYDKFIQGVFGESMAKSLTDLHSYISLYNPTNPNNCVTKLKSGTPQCIGDYNPYTITDLKCDDSETLHFFDVSINNYCSNCNTDICKTNCFLGSSADCTCHLQRGQYWLRKHKTSRKTYCEYLPYIDFSVLNDDYFQVPSSITCESTLEFWLYVYSYNTGKNNFQKMQVIWDLHSAVMIDIKNNGLNVMCYPVYNSQIEDQYTEQITLSMTAYRWNLIRCGADMASAEPTFFFNSNSQPLVATCPVERLGKALITNLIFKSRRNPHSFGYVFLKGIKLWQEYNYKYVDTSYIDISSIGEYDESILRSTSSKYPGLIAYFKNELNKEEYLDTAKREYTIINELGHEDTSEHTYDFHRIKVFQRDNNFWGYNYIDPKNEGYYSELITCQEGSVFNSATNTCLTPTLTHCEFPGDISDNCISCPETTPYLHPVDGSCVANCPVRFYNDDNISRCRACHYTCYTCSARFYNNCTSCIDDYKLVEKLGLCVLNCEEYGLTRSAVDPNRCTEFDADAVLINVAEGVPIDVNNFNEIVAKVTAATSTGYTTNWVLNEEKTKELNDDPDMTFDTYPWTDFGTEHEAPDVVIGKEFTTPLDTTFFQLDKYYSFDLEIIKTNQTGRVVYVKNFNLTMNKRPVGGGLDTIPKIGLYNTTTFVITCDGWSDDTTETKNLEYYFYSIEDKTSTQKLLSDWSTVNEITSNFTVIYYQQENSTIKIYCKIRDNYGAITEVDTEIVIANKLSGTTYKLYDAIINFQLPNEVDTELLYHRSQYLMSLGIDTYKTLQPELFQTKYEPSLDATVITKSDPSCTSDYCNTYGECSLIDEFLVCNCDNGRIGRNCHIASYGYQQVEDAYKDMYDKLFGLLQSTISYEQFMVMHNLYFAACQFFQDEAFFSQQLDTFLTLAMNLFTDSILNNTAEYFDLIDYYYSYTLDRLNKKRIEHKLNTGWPFRNVSLEYDQVSEFKTAFDYISTELNTFLKYLAQQYLNTQKTITYESKNFYVALTSLNPTFDEEAFFYLRKKNYKSSVQFMKCLTYIEVEKLANPYFQAWLIYIEYNRFPFSYNKTLNPNNTSPMVEMRFLDGTTGKDITISGCSGDNGMLIEMPFTSFNWLEELNRQKWLHDPNNYKSPSDPIFRDPIYINKSGYISNDTIEQRIEKYNRLYNLTGMYYDTQLEDFNRTGINYVNFTSDTNFIQFTSEHLSKFTSFFVENKVKFTVNNRFFYIRRPQVMKWWPNYTSNRAFFIIGGFVGLYVFLVFVLTLYDNRYFRQESLLEFLKREIIRVALPYMKDKDKEINRLVPTGFNPGIKATRLFGKKTNLDDELFMSNKLDFGEKDKKDLLNLNKIQDDDNADEKTEKISDGEAESDMVFKKKKKKKKGKFFNKDTTSDDGGNKKNPFMNEDDLTQAPNTNEKSKARTLNNLPSEFEDKDLEYKARLQSFADLNLPMLKFMCANMLERNIFISPIINVSLFNPRWKKLTMLVSEVCIMSTMNSVFLTADEKITHKTIGGCIKVSILSMLCANTVMYILAVFFTFSRSQRRRLYKLVTSGGQLIILKEWEDMVCHNAFFTIIGLFIHYGIWAWTFYISVAFVAVWKVQAKAYSICMISGAAFDFLIFEFALEFFISIIYLGRKNNEVFRRIGEFLNRARNYRCLWP